MDYLLILEFVGMVLTMRGAFLVSRGNDRAMYLGLISFIMANIVMFAFATGKGMVPLQIQMVFFFLGSLPALRAYAPNWNKLKIILLIVIPVYLVILISFMEFKINILGITSIEVIAAVIAITGSYILRYKVKDVMVLSFILFFVADIFYVYISVEKGLLFFGIQSLFFWYTSIAGVKTNLNGESFKSYLIRQKERFSNIQLKRRI